MNAMFIARTFCLCLLSLSLWLPCVAHAAEVAEVAEVASPDGSDPSRYDVIWDSPSRDTNGTMPIGNGDIGANVWVESNGDLLFYISKTDSWGDNGRLLKVGKLRVTCNPPLIAKDTTFSQRLNLQAGTIVIDAKSGKRTTQLTFWIDAHHPVIHVSQKSNTPVSMTAQVELWRTKQTEYGPGGPSDLLEDRSKPSKLHRKVTMEPDTVVTGLKNELAWYHHNIKSDGFDLLNKTQGLTEYFKGKNPLLHRTFGGWVTGTDVTRINDTTLQTRSATSGRIDITVLTTTPDVVDTSEEWLKKIKTLAAKSASTSIEQRYAAHTQWWSAFWNRSWIHVTPTDTDGGTQRLIPASKHKVKVGADQNGKGGFGGKVGRVSFFEGVIDAEGVRKLATSDRKVITQKTIGKTIGKGTAVKLIGSWINLAANQELDQVKAENLKGSVTIEAWIQPGTGAGRILDMITPGGGDGFLLDVYPAKGIRFIAGKTWLQQKNVLKPGEWQHVAVTADAGARTFSLYLDGKIILSSKVDDGLNDATLVARSYALQRYLDACAGRGAHPIKFNGSIFTAPHKGDPDYRRWGQGYWWQNTRLPYLSMCASGDYEMMKPLFKMYAEDLFKMNQFRTRKYLGHGGVFYAECAHFWGSTFSATYGWTPFEDRKDKLQESGWHKWEWVAGPELVFMMLDYVDYREDKKFLHSHVIPVGIEVMRFFDEHYKTNPQGKLVMHPSMACETWWDCTNPMPELAGLHALTTRFLALPKGELSKKQRAFCVSLQKKLPPLPTRMVKGAKALAPAARFAQRKNVENPELYAVFPFRLCSFEKKNAELGEVALKHRWSRGASGWRQDDLFMTHLGLSEQAKNNLVSRCKNKHKASRFPIFWGPNYDWVPDQDHGGVMMRTVQTMLIQPDPYSKKIYLKPAWPKGWDCEFQLRAPYNTVIRGRLKKGKVVDLVVTPKSRQKDVIIVK